MKRKESKKQTTISPSAYKFNEYIVMATSLDSSISYKEIIELYRFRWQVELYFKRLKSILGYGEGKLMIALLIESIIGNADFSPFDDYYEEYMERDEDGEADTVEQYC